MYPVEIAGGDIVKELARPAYQVDNMAVEVRLGRGQPQWDGIYCVLGRGRRPVTG